MHEAATIPVLEEFYSVQGEGFHTGKAAYFLRVGGCDLGCRWCDSKDSWNAPEHLYVPIEEILVRIEKSGANTVVVTGGEPMLYDFSGFTRLARNRGIDCYLETSGAYCISGEWHWICLSPKQQEPPVAENFCMADELKIIVYEDDDYKWAEQCALRVKPSCKLFLQPEWSRFKQNAQAIAEYVKKHPEWQISLQTHKFMNIP